MKKLLILFAFIFGWLFANSQYPVNQNLGSDSTLVTSKGGLKGRLVNTNFVDTTSANLQRISQYPGSQIYTTFDNSFWLRNSTASKWDKQASISDIISIIGCNSLLTGGIVTYSGTGLIFDVSPASYFINCGGIYNSTQTQVTLSVADATHPRVDVIAVNTSGNVIVLTGTPSANPVKPQINGETQLELTHIEVAAGATTPGGVTTLIIYDENTEWATTSSNVTCNFNNLTNPFHGSKAALATTVSEGSILKFDYGSVDVNLSEYSALKLYIRTEGSTGDYGTFFPKFGYNDAIIGSVTVNNGSYGFESGSDGSYQIVTIPIEDFLLTSNIVNELYIEFGNVGFATCYVDYIQLQGGISSGTSPYITNIFRKTATDSVFMVINNVPVFAFKDSSGGAGTPDSTIYSTRAWRQKGDDSLGAVKWGLTGNEGLDSSVNFLGSITNNHLLFRVNNEPAGFIQSSPSINPSSLTGGVALGHYAAGVLIEKIIAGTNTGVVGLHSSVYIGPHAGRNIGADYANNGKTKSGENVFIGSRAGFFTQQISNIGYGRNVAIGASSMNRNVDGGENTSVGAFSMEGVYNGSGNTALGRDALRTISSGGYNTGVGILSLGQNSTGIISCTVTNGGSGYTTATVTFSAPYGGGPGLCSATATGTAVIDMGVITNIIITNPGCGYTNDTLVLFPGYVTPHVTITITGDGVNAAATANIQSADYNTAIGAGSGLYNIIGKYNVYVGNNAGVSPRYWDSRNTFLGSFADIDGGISATTQIRSSVGLGQSAKVTRSYQLGISDSINSFTFKGISRGTAGYVLTDSLGDGEYWVARPSGSGSYTFSNGLTEAAGAVKLGGTIGESTQIYPDTEDAYNLDIGDPTPFKNIGIYAKNQLYIGTTNPATDWSSEIHFYDDSLVLRPGLSKLYIDSLNYTLSTTGKKIMLRDTATGLVQNIDPALLGFGATNTLAVFGAGAGLATDTAAFQTTSIYGSFYNDGNDTLIITKAIGVLQGSSPSITPTIYFNDSLNVTAGATKLINSPSALTNTATGTAVTSFDNYKIPPGVWVWVATPTVGTKPTYFSMSLIGYKKRVI